MLTRLFSGCVLGGRQPQCGFFASNLTDPSRRSNCKPERNLSSNSSMSKTLPLVSEIQKPQDLGPDPDKTALSPATVLSR